MRAFLILLALALACVPPVSASCASTTHAAACAEVVDSDPDFASVVLTQQPGPAGSGAACVIAGGDAEIGIASNDVDAFALACLTHSDGVTGNSYSCAWIENTQQPSIRCVSFWNANGVLGPSGVGLGGNVLCVQVSGILTCTTLS